jgi:hypothetical protein
VAVSIVASPGGIELFRNVPATIHELRLALAGLPKNMKVKADSEMGVSEKTVDELRARTTWPPGLVVTMPRELRPKSVVKIIKEAHTARDSICRAHRGRWRRNV